MSATQHIGDARGRIALWLDKEGALALASTFGPSDAGYDELIRAVERAYPDAGGSIAADAYLGHDEAEELA